MADDLLRQQLGLTEAEFAALFAPRSADNGSRRAVVAAVRERFGLAADEALGRGLWERQIIHTADALVLDHLGE
jgi:hypothetical protein